MSTATGRTTRSPERQLADSHESIRVHGARVNNLKDLSVEIPKRRLTAAYVGSRAPCALRSALPLGSTR